MSKKKIKLEDLHLDSYVDTHCHIDSTCEKMGISTEEYFELISSHCELLNHNACDPEGLDWIENSGILEHPKVHFSAGIHPHDAKEYNEDIHAQLLRLNSHEKCLAWGEMGLDYHYDFSPRNVQQDVFEKQLQSAVSLGRPIVIHTREADEDTLRILRAHLHDECKIHIHCYTNNAEFAGKLMELPGDFFFGFTGVLTFKTAEEIREALKIIPQNRILLETDSPYMAPTPYRGKPCHSGMIPFIANQISQTLETPIEHIFQQCRENTKLMYGV